MEHLAGLFDGETDSFRIPVETIRGLLRIRSWTELETFTNRLATIRGLDIKRNGNVFEIKAPILLELQDRDFKKARKVSGDDAPKNKIKKEIKNIIKETVLIFDFEIAYNLYPLKKGKSKGIEKLKRDVKTPEDFELLKKSVINYKKYLDRNKTDPKFIKHFSTFVGEWRDWIEVITTATPAQKMASNRHKDEMFEERAKIEANYTGKGLEMAAQDPEMKKILEKLTSGKSILKEMPK